METTRLSSKGQVIIPKGFRASHHWSPGLELEVIDAGDGVLLKPCSPFAATSIQEAAGFLKRAGKKPLSLKEMDEAIRKGVRRQWRVRD